MADRDDSRDVGVFDSWMHSKTCPWEDVDGQDDCTRYVPHSDLEAAERERDELRREVSRLVEALGVARNAAEKVTTARDTLWRLRNTIDCVIDELGKGDK